MSETDGLFSRAGDSYLPTGVGVSPWNSAAQSGIALAGLAAHVLGQTPMPATMHLARLSLDILGAAPIAPLTPTLRILRQSTRQQLIEVELIAHERTWLRATALRIRTEPSPSHLSAHTRAFPGADAKPARRFAWAETITLEGDTETPGPGARWVRFCTPVVVGHPLTALEATAMLSDYGSGIAPLVSAKDWTFANLDLAVHLLRAPALDWLLIEASAESAGNGIGIVTSRLGDRDGLFATAHQTIFLNRRSSLDRHQKIQRDADP